MLKKNRLCKCKNINWKLEMTELRFRIHVSDLEAFFKSIFDYCPACGKPCEKIKPKDLGELKSVSLEHFG